MREEQTSSSGAVRVLGWDGSRHHVALRGGLEKEIALDRLSFGFLDCRGVKVSEALANLVFFAVIQRRLAVEHNLIAPAPRGREARIDVGEDHLGNSLVGAHDATSFR